MDGFWIRIWNNFPEIYLFILISEIGVWNGETKKKFGFSIFFFVVCLFVPFYNRKKITTMIIIHNAHPPLFTTNVTSSLSLSFLSVWFQLSTFYYSPSVWYLSFFFSFSLDIYRMSSLMIWSTSSSSLLSSSS